MPDRRGRSSDQRDFAVLFDAFDSLSNSADATSDLVGSTVISESDLGRLFEGFEAVWRPYLEEHAHEPPSLNIWQVAELGLDEVRNCRVLKWLLDPNESHFQGTRFLRCFFEMMGEPWPSQPDEVPLVRREVSADAYSRLDLLIEFRSVRVCIEVKIQAREDTAQIEKYSGTGRLIDKQFVGRLLTASGESGELIVDGFKRLLWSDVANALKRFAHRRGNEDNLAARSGFVSQLAMQYAEFITSHFQSKRAQS